MSCIEKSHQSICETPKVVISITNSVNRYIRTRVEKEKRVEKGDRRMLSDGT